MIDNSVLTCLDFVCTHSLTLCDGMNCLICSTDWFIFDIPLVQPPKRSPQTRGTTVCRSRRSGTIAQPAAAMIAPDPDLLIPIRAPYPCEEEGVFLKTLKKQYVSFCSFRG